MIAFNSDSPHLPVSVLERAFEILAAHDVVVGPTYDGGYYLVGAKAPMPRSLMATGWEQAVRSRPCWRARAAEAFRWFHRSLLRH